MCYRTIKFRLIPGQHCFIRFNGNDSDTLSFDPDGIHPDPVHQGATCRKAEGREGDGCVKQEIQKCQNYNFFRNNCCYCIEQALKACGQYITSRQWPNWPINPGPQLRESGYKP